MSILDTRDAALTYAAGDVMAYRAPLGTAAPTPFDDLTTPWLCCGWIETSGTTFKLGETYKEVMAAGSLDPIRTILCADQDVPGELPGVPQPGRGLPVRRRGHRHDPPRLPGHLGHVHPARGADRQPVRVGVLHDRRRQEDLELRPNGKVTARGDDQSQQGDVTACR